MGERQTTTTTATEKGLCVVRRACGKSKIETRFSGFSNGSAFLNLQHCDDGTMDDAAEA